MTVLRVRLGSRSYPVLVGRELLGRCGRLVAAHSGDGRAFLVTSARVARLHARAVVSSCRRAGLAVRVLTVPDGERAKTVSVAESLLRALARASAGRDSCVVALGGGTIGDLAGFVASVYARGIAVVQVPTTLVAQVDAAIGGKTGVDLPEGKNLVGTFHQPVAVVADTLVLGTLPPRQLRAGLAEVVKYGMIGSPALFTMVERNAAGLLRADPALLERVVMRCARMKAHVVSRDEREGGPRVMLNFGHTAGHAIEAASGFRVTHGEAVAMGMLVATRLSSRRGLCAPGLVGRLAALLRALGLPISASAGLSRARVRAALGRDKKRKESGLRFILTRGMGNVTVSGGVRADEIIGEILGAKGESS